LGMPTREIEQALQTATYASSQTEIGASFGDRPLAGAA
jgi:hypothetical protein